ncbi:U3 small nucleolar RNA-associated protein 6 homolog [Schistocerca gregaria]|uniref:U3 small nucleolar RNA-associated protein 6 homolog n=1 Tax=Schistocerca gregaria TaxID=7010 RepID=UPI00211E7293|nr:U3 small nucleolar RNA-associated protein 6 homolog [Schistocerca gregaria]
MADLVQEELEGMIPELEKLQAGNVLSSDEVKKVIRSRRRLEYSTRRPGKELVDFLRYIEYELNLDFLIRRRSARLKFKDKARFAATRKVHRLFQGALKKFKGDTRLWFQFIDFVGRGEKGRALNRIFVEAISLHPKYPPFWIAAACWEYFRNDNILAARTLLQRGNRFNPDSEEIYLEYARLELAYRQKIQIRIQWFGVDESKLKSSEGTEGKVLEGLSTTQGEEASTKRGVLEEMKGNGLSLDSVSNPFLQGMIPLSIYKVAVARYKKRLGLRKKFVKIFLAFANTRHLVEEIYQDIELDFPDDPEVLSFVARKPCDVFDLVIRGGVNDGQMPKIERLSVNRFMVVSECIENYQNFLQSHPSTPLYESYFSFLVSSYVDCAEASQQQGIEDERADLKRFLERKIPGAFKRGFQDGHISEKISLQWIDWLLARERVEDAHMWAEKLSAKFFNNPSIRLINFLLVARSRDGPLGREGEGRAGEKGDRELLEEVARALQVADLVHEGLGGLFYFYAERIIAARMAVDQGEMELGVYQEACEKALTAYKRVLSGLTGKREALIRFKENVLSQMVEFYAKSTQVVEKATMESFLRRIYEVSLDYPPNSKSYFKKILEFEIYAEGESEEKVKKIHTEIIEHALREFGQDDPCIWLEAIDWEKRHGGSIKRIGVLYHRAKRMLKNPDQFVAQYSQMVNAD